MKMTTNSLDIIVRKLEGYQAELTTVMKTAAELNEKSTKLKKQIEYIKNENLKIQELLKKMSNVR